nr:hypothetical protein [Tanacetum cinerariifolium]
MELGHQYPIQNIARSSYCFSLKYGWIFSGRGPRIPSPTETNKGMLLQQKLGLADQQKLCFAVQHKPGLADQQNGLGLFGLTGFPVGLLPNIPFPSAFLLANLCS